MFDHIKKRCRGMITIKALCEQAEKHAFNDAQRKPGAEHFALSAIDLPDGTANLVFARVGKDASSLKDAIQSQYKDALQYVGLQPTAFEEQTTTADVFGQRHGVYSVAASGQELMQMLAAARESQETLLGAHVISIVADMEHGVTARALHVMGVDKAALKLAAEDVIRKYLAV